MTAISIFKPWVRVSYSLIGAGVNGTDDSPVRQQRRKYMLPITISVILVFAF